MYVLRQIQSALADGQLASMSEATRFPWRLRDILPKYALKVASGLYTSGFQLVTTASFTVPLPDDYSSSQKLYYAFRTMGTVKATVVSPTHGTTKTLIKGTTGTTDGEHHGLFIGVGDITSIALICNTATECQVEWFMFQLPDLTDADSYRLGQIALGVSA